MNPDDYSLQRKMAESRRYEETRAAQLGSSLAGQGYSGDAAIPVAVPVSEQIIQQVAQLQTILKEIGQRADATASKLGYGKLESVNKDPRPTRAGVLGQISDSLDATEPQLRRIIDALEYIARQV